MDSYSRSSRPVMRYPEITKNTSTPMNPPLGHPSRWSSTTTVTANARRPWMSGRTRVRLVGFCRAGGGGGMALFDDDGGQDGKGPS
ncbi:hypothetical protein [Arthrobacter sp. RIT-PI-e]|uniref:hypothetical protein n=1 Tax=Arthrobacter sp. RIT-PI-e TaxID=1681197 RepID=UPI001F2A7530|nr:hypothetical protein [Arthrobacter sp. RIT-PI-e]